MSDQFERFTTPPPLHPEPGFVRDARELAERLDSATSAVAETFARANISVEVDGDVSTWSDEGQGALFVGDHRNGAEYAPLLAAFGDVGRTACHFVAKPFSLSSRVRNTLTSSDARINLPVIPRTLASDRQDTFNRDLHWRIMRRGNLPTEEELKTLNANTLQDSADLVAAGHIVTIYPTGGVMDAIEKPWQQGLGRIIQQVPEDARDRVAVVPFRFDDFSKVRLISSLVMVRYGLEPSPQTIVLRLGRQGSVNEVLEGSVDELTAREITAALREQFVTAFGGQDAE